MKDEKSTSPSGVILTRFPLEGGWGGEEKLHLSLLDSLKKTGVQTSVWSSDKTLVTEFQKHSHIIEYSSWYRDITTLWTLILFPILGILLLLEGFVQLRKKRNQGFEVVLMLTFLEKIVLTPLAHLLGFRVIWAHHAPLGNWFYRHPLLKIWQSWSKYVTIITPSAAMRDALAKAHPKGRIEVVPNPVMLVPGDPKTRADFRKHYHIPSEGIVVSTAGRLSAEKNPLEFVRLSERFPEATFVMAGEGKMRSHIEQIISSKKLTNVILLGHLSETELAAFYAASDIFCVLSDYETFCLAAAEAVACGVPVIAARAGGIPEVVIDGKTGLLFRPQDFEAAADALQKLIIDPEFRRRIRQNGKTDSKRFGTEEYERKMHKTLFGS